MNGLADISGFLNIANNNQQTSPYQNKNCNFYNPHTAESMQGVAYVPKDVRFWDTTEIKLFKENVGYYITKKQAFNQLLHKYRQVLGNLDTQEQDPSLWSLINQTSTGLARVNGFSNQLVNVLDKMGTFIDNPAVPRQSIYG